MLILSQTRPIVKEIDGCGPNFNLKWFLNLNGNNPKFYEIFIQLTLSTKLVIQLLLTLKGKTAKTNQRNIQFTRKDKIAFNTYQQSSTTKSVMTTSTLSLQSDSSASGNRAPVSVSSSHREREKSDNIPRMKRYDGITKAMQLNAIMKARNVDSTFID